MKKYLLAATYFLSLEGFSQDDSLFNKQLDEFVVTATRTERKLGNVAVPVKIIQQSMIRRAGSVRLKDILQEQAGLFITSGFGAGVQLQGLNPDYTLILVDGEPLVGRTAGVLDLNRITVGNIRKIEIVKGPSSSLYGSEAMAGVINIITDRSYKKELTTTLRYGFGDPDRGWAIPFGAQTFNNSDFQLSGSFKMNKLGLQFNSNANYLDGFSYRPFSGDRSSQPIWRLTNQGSIGYQFSTRTKFNLGFRHTNDRIRQEFSVSNNGAVYHSFGTEINKDLGLNTGLTHQFSQRLRSSLRLYASFYNGLQHLNFTEKPDSSYHDEFQQHFYRVEDQTDLSFKKSTLTFGAGFISDQVQSTRYDDFENKKVNTITYGFSQFEWNPTGKITLISGFRYDNNALFAGAFSPKLAIRFQPNKKLRLNASIGRGFKAPDFRQLYLNFTNSAAGGYSVYGSIDAIRIIEAQQVQGLISEVKEDFYKLKKLTPEFSTGINLGGSFQPITGLSINLNLFRNDIEDLIDVREVATRSNGAQVYSYINVKNAYTQGTEVEVEWKPLKKLHIISGYQFLLTGDKDEINSILKGKEYARNPDGSSRLLERSEYVGLPNRSRHMANLKLMFEDDHKLFATARLVYRDKWVVANRDGNGVYNKDDEFAKGFFLLNISAGKELEKGHRLQAGMDNVLNYQDVNYLPHLQGRNIYLSIQLKLIKHKQSL